MSGVTLHRGILDISETPENFLQQKYTTEVLTTPELKTSLKRLDGTNSLILKNLLIEAYNRVAQSFANLVAILIGAAFCLTTRRSSRFLGIGLGFLISLLFYGVNAVSISLGRSGMLPPFLAVWFSNILFGSLGIYLINRF